MSSLRTWFDQFVYDVRHAWRAILRMPGLAAVVVVSLAAGIGVNTVVFSWIQARVLRPLPGVPDGGAFELIEPRTEAGSFPGASWLEYRDLAERQRAFRALLGFRPVPLYVGETGRVERIYGLLVSGNYFSVLGLTPALGRALQPADTAKPGGELVAVVSHGFWQSRLGARPDAIGRTLRINGRDITIVGVAPRDFHGTISGLSFELYLPATLAPLVSAGSRELEDRRSRGYTVVGRFREGVTGPQAQAEVDATFRDLARLYPESNRSIAGEVLPFWDSPRGPQRLLTGAIAVLQVTLLLLMLAICGNAANLVLARASTRQREMGVRLALGAGPWRIARLLLAENVMLALGASVLGAAFAAWGTSALRVIPLSGFPLRFETSLDAQGLAFASLLGLACGTLVGLAAALPLVRLDPQRAVRAGTRAATRSRLRNTLMAVQVGLASLVLIVAALFLRGFLETKRIDPGFRREGVLLAAYDFSGRGVAPAEARSFTAMLLARLRERAPIESAAVSSAVPLDIHGLPSRSFAIEGRARADGVRDEASTNVVTPGYFALLGIPFLAGRDFTDLRDEASDPQAIVNDAFVSRYLSDVEPIGRRLESRGRRYTIVGVVRTTVSNAFGEPPTPALYLSYRDNPLPMGEIHVRGRSGREALLAPEIRRVVGALDAELPVFNVRSLSDHVDTNLVFRRVPARMFVVLGPLLVLLAAIGIYAVVAYTSAQRTTEIGVRMALGATSARVLRDLVGESLRVVALGASLGWLVAFVVVMDLLEHERVEWIVFAGVPALLLAVATAACWLPARRATRVDPSTALRQE